MNQKKLSMYYLFFSATGALLIIGIARFGSSNTNNIHIFDKLVIGGAFILSCLFGICTAIKPNWTKRFQKQGNQGKQVNQIKMMGHHPDCERFKSHSIKIKNNILCPGCGGLALGSIISIFSTGIYFMFLKEIPSAILQLLVILGMALIAINYMEIMIPTRNACLHLISNVFLVIGFFFIIVGIFHLTGSTIFGIFAILISFLWLDTRIQLSNWRHSEVCINCIETCKAY